MQQTWLESELISADSTFCNDSLYTAHTSSIAQVLKCKTLLLFFLPTKQAALCFTKGCLLLCVCNFAMLSNDNITASVVKLQYLHLFVAFIYTSISEDPITCYLTITANTIYII